jgi:hypothetical protein
MFEAMTRGLPRRVTVCGRIQTRLASWSLARAEFAALRQAVASAGVDTAELDRDRELRR